MTPNPIKDRTSTTARAWALRRHDGVVLGFTDHDRPLSFAGVQFRPDSGLEARQLVQTLGLSVDHTEAMGLIAHEAITEADLNAGRWDGAEVTVWEVDWTSLDHRVMFRGHLGEISHQSGAFRAELRGQSEALAHPQGRAFHRRCSARLGDGRCGINANVEPWMWESEVAGVNRAILRLRGGAQFGAGWFTHGRAEICDGPLAGVSFPIKTDRFTDMREVTLWQPLDGENVIGAKVKLYAGCDKRAETCRVKFDNYLNFRGFPHLPGEDFLMTPKANRG